MLTIVPMIAVLLLGGGSMLLLRGAISDWYQSGPASGSLAHMGLPPHQMALVGTWVGSDPRSGEPYLLRFWEWGNLEFIPEGMSEGYSGQYQWLDEKTVQLRLAANTPPDALDGLCADLPPELAGWCQSRLVVYDPAAYPAPEPTVVLPTLAPGELPRAPYPAPPIPTPAPFLAEEMKEPFAVLVEGGTLTLTHPSSAVLTLQRWTGEP